MTTPVFVVGTGRCGSTLLSNMLRQHPDVLSVSEFFSFVTDLGGRIAECFDSEPMDAKGFAYVVCTATPKLSLLLRHDLVMDEVLYRGTPGGRHSPERGVPSILQTALPHLSDDPEALFDDVRGFVAKRPVATLAKHYAALFDWLTQRFGKRRWVERSGGSLRVVRRLREAFPDARFVHIVRDGRDCAISMSRHYGFRMALIAAQLTEILGVDPFESDNRDLEEDLPDEFIDYLPERFDSEKFRNEQTPLPLCAHYWSGECMAGVVELAEIAPGRLLTVRYEDLLTEPEPSLERLMAFIDPELVNADWARHVAKGVRAPRSSYRDLPAATLTELTEACRPGFAALGDLYATANT